MHLGQAGERARPHPAQVVADLRQAHRDRPGRTGQLDEGVAGTLRLEVVARLGERQAGVRSRARSRTAAANPGGVLMPGADGGAAERHLGHPRAGPPRSRSMPRRTCAAYPPSSWPSVTGVASMRWVRPALTTSAVRPACVARTPRRGARSAGTRSSSSGPRGREVDGGRERVVARLRGVDLVVRVHLPPEPAARERGDHLVDVHVRRGARPGLEDVDGELVRRARRPPTSCAARGHGVRDVARQDAEVGVDPGRGRLDPRQCTHDGRVDPDAADREVLDGALGLRAVERVGRDARPRPSCRARRARPRGSSWPHPGRGRRRERARERPGWRQVSRVRGPGRPRR